MVDKLAPQAIMLSDLQATDAAIAGAKAARLAQALRSGMPVLPGFVVTAVGPDHTSGHDLVRTIGVRTAWAQLSDHGTAPLVVRSSSTAEDGDSSSMAGLFTSMVDVRGWRAFGAAVDEVLSSANRPEGFRPMAVLVQRFLKADVGGVLFGADPITGRRDRIIVAAAAGGPQELVSGTTTGARYITTHRGRRLRVDNADDGRLTDRQLTRLARLAQAAGTAFGGPQDIEWAFDDGDQLYLLQSRPLTALPAPVARRAPLLGAGPVAETFPDPLSRLEQDLWVEPLRSGLTHALTLTGAASARRLQDSPIVTVVDGRVVADLDLLDPGSRPRRRAMRLLDPRPGARRLRAAWRVGQLRATLPAHSADLLAELDGQLTEIPPLTSRSDDDLLVLLTWTKQTLAVLHAHEMLAGVVGGSSGGDLTAASVALQVLTRASAHRESLPEREPVVLALTRPAIRPASPLPEARRPAVPAPSSPSRSGATIWDLPAREAARLRVRWVHELAARTALELGDRLAAAGVLQATGAVRDLSVHELTTAVRKRRLPLPAKLRPAAEEGAPLPPVFQLNPDGQPVPVDLASGRRRRGKAAEQQGQPAGGGRGVGVVHDGNGPPPAGSVLVVQNLDPDLAVHLPVIAGLVSETGSPLSHLAILARELSVPTVVGVPAARARFARGQRVLVDGGVGQVFPLDLRAEEESA